jgi:hypothetical protein
MPRTQVATVPVFDFGAPISGDPQTAEANRVLKFKVKDQQGGKLTIDVESDEVPLNVSVLVSEDNVTWTPLTVAVTGLVPGVAATGSVSLAGLPSDGDTVTISDGTTSTIFEFKTAGPATGTNTLVLIGATPAAAAAALHAAINAEVGFAVTSTYVAAATSLTLARDTIGIAGNVAITKSGTNITVVGMAGGVDHVDGTAVSPVTIKPLCHKVFEPVLRAGKDKFFAIGAVGGGRGRATIRECFFDVIKL